MGGGGHFKLTKRVQMKKTGRGDGLKTNDVAIPANYRKVTTITIEHYKKGLKFKKNCPTK